ncbi:isopenicillin N synthase family dioxygenase [Legionella bononiensis]|uniref:2-oxoglutarate-dependent ethylene/succinate-forming enzyme n=1 Tax=Legionella bononiensis TaxID=2793102 RepID=A0ABS1WDQ7_9GAMM|nr:2OG-Fe(II) oxygenase family protein [Legionella bononiensis]MBL7481452.1 isopenicillin N synthase family oxygenase [Legionella bononiensis]MBL7527484.1 isopenicillin N synthase family oxygenase [Legionella bononiensis]
MNVLKIDFEHSDAKGQFASSLHHTGFAVLENHPIDIQLINEIYQEWMTFFNSENKYKYQFVVETQDGYFPASISEKAKGAELKDLKEFYQYYPWGQYPQNMGNNTRKLYQQLTQLASTLLAWLEEELPPEIANTLSMPLSAMIEHCEQTMLRILHYPPLSGNEPVGAVRAAAHEDINLITLLVGATSSGLQVKDNQGNWHEVPCSKESIVVNNGDMLDLATNHYYRSTTHRVVNPHNSNVARLSMPLFLHPNPDVLLSPDKTAKRYLYERLVELGLK